MAVVHLAVRIALAVSSGVLFTKDMADSFEALVVEFHRQYAEAFGMDNVLPNFHMCACVVFVCTCMVLLIFNCPVLHLPAALLRFSSVYAIASWSYERLHQLSKRVCTNNTAIEMSIMRRSLLVLKNGIARVQHTEAVPDQTAAGVAKLQQEFAAQRFHGEVHPRLNDNDPQWQRRLDVGMLPQDVAMQWPVTPGRTRAMISDIDLAGIKTHFGARSMGTGFDVRAYRSPDAKTSMAVTVGADAFIFELYFIYSNSTSAGKWRPVQAWRACSSTPV
jgi:hypothetical protein